MFDLMPTSTVEDWDVVATRLAAVPGALRGYVETLRTGIAEGVMPARRQVVEVATQIDRYTADDGFFAAFVAEADPDEGQLPASLARTLADNSAAARVAYDELRRFLAEELAPAAGDVDAVGRELYALNSRRFLGATIDLDETYEWGREELARMVAEQTAIANEILPGASVEEAVAHLEADPTRKLVGTEALQTWMQETSDRAVAELGASHFDIPEAIRTLECMIARSGWVGSTTPARRTTSPVPVACGGPFPRASRSSTPGANSPPSSRGCARPSPPDRAGGLQPCRELNSWRRLLAGTSGHAEGWALYAERLMEQLGYLDDPADRLGMLDGQRMRAARVVLDIGVHLGKPRLDGTGVWDADYALDFMRHNVNMSDQFVQFEVNRYLAGRGRRLHTRWDSASGSRSATASVPPRVSRSPSRTSTRGRSISAAFGLDTLRTALLPR